jgi:surface antigen
MKRQSILAYAVATTLSLSLLPQVSLAAGINPFPNGVENLTKGEAAAIKSAIQEALKTYQSGNVVKWTSPDSKRTGEVTVLQTYQQAGRRCASLQNKFTESVGTTYQLPFCEVSAGSWKVSF